MGLRRGLRKLLKYQEPDPYLNDSYSQEGEDMVLARIFDNKPTGFFVDVGALHPKRFSNTYKFYKTGWRGINMDAMPGSMAIFNQLRPEDINIEAAISDEDQVLKYHIFNEPALNTLSEEVAMEREKKPEYKVQRVEDICTQTLASILDKHLPEGKAIDFMTIDAEGLDFQVLNSNNWAKYRPSVLLLESELDFDAFGGSDLYLFMKDRGYSLLSRTYRTYFLREQNFKALA
ncbi:FkbM family methyltransferase [Mucilaginibacter sp. RS28]|uniref:FkbM family methyltransferase n=1 Tax=Mucilaginibacter straminoryzae TaxID=2932774 RepID=A0A9X2BC56_9SPHI|nr:FkbM family methyltransferase [Mucilaginibacter straminoryzae]MCJ8210542.1 FkbM family methyltransferase [Mucilaginibacter straminoryzae]